MPYLILPSLICSIPSPCYSVDRDFKNLELIVLIEAAAQCYHPMLFDAVSFSAPDHFAKDPSQSFMIGCA